MRTPANGQPTVHPIGPRGGAEGFVVADIDVKRLFFGPGRASPTHKDGGHLEDINDDGFLDLLSHYRTPIIDIQSGDVEACLRGQLLDRTPFSGCDSISTSKSK